jgi:hypothetical protein
VTRISYKWSFETYRNYEIVNVLFVEADLTGKFSLGAQKGFVIKDLLMRFGGNAIPERLFLGPNHVV